MDISLFEVSATIVNFVIFCFILSKLLFKPVGKIIASRETEISDRIKKTEENEKKAENLRLEREENLKDSRTQGKKIVEDLKQKAEAVSEDILKDAREEAETLIERARREVEREREKAQAEIKTQAIDLAILLSTKALETTIDEEQHRKLIKDFISKVGI